MKFADKQRILISAYACEPGRGSESEVGWRWVNGLAERGFEVHVITRANNQVPIENQGSSGCVFHYVDLPFFSRLKRWSGSTYWYYILWQLSAIKMARRLVRDLNFKYCHHVTFVSARLVTCLAFCQTRFIWGPLAGGDVVPPSLVNDLPLGVRVREFIRLISNKMSRFDPFIRWCACKAEKIIVTSEASMKLLPVSAQGKCLVASAIGIDLPSVVPKRRKKNTGPNVLFVGRADAIKGLKLAVDIFIAAYGSGQDQACLTVVGDGPELSATKRYANRVGISERIRWCGWVPREQLSKFYSSTDLFLFTGFRDSGGMVILEALSYGLPVVALQTGGAATIVHSGCGHLVKVDCHRSEIVAEAANAMREIWNEPIYTKLVNGAFSRAMDYAWDKVVRVFD